MPIFDFRCPECDNVEKDVFLKSWDSPWFCNNKINENLCLHQMEKIPSRFLAAIFPNGGIFLEHVSPEGKTFYSKKEMREYATEHDLELGAL